MRPAGVEPTSPASEADALSIELRAQITGGYLPPNIFYHIRRKLCLPEHSIFIRWRKNKIVAILKTAANSF